MTLCTMSFESIDGNTDNLKRISENSTEHAIRLTSQTCTYKRVKRSLTAAANFYHIKSHNKRNTLPQPPTATTLTLCHDPQPRFHSQRPVLADQPSPPFTHPPARLPPLIARSKNQPQQCLPPATSAAQSPATTPTPAPCGTPHPAEPPPPREGNPAPPIPLLFDLPTHQPICSHRPSPRHPPMLPHIPRHLVRARGMCWFWLSPRHIPRQLMMMIMTIPHLRLRTPTVSNHHSPRT
jgi:hypothetical protein